MSAPELHGISRRQEINRQQLQRHTGTWFEQYIGQHAHTLFSFTALFCFCALLYGAIGVYFITLPYSAALARLADLFLFAHLVSIIIVWQTKPAPLLDPIASATHILGHDRDTGLPIAASSQTMATHILIISTTGGGKTESLLSLSHQNLLQCSPIIFIDGKADIKTFNALYQRCLETGRLNDLLLLNFLTSTRADPTADPHHETLTDHENKRLSCSINILSAGSADEIKELFSALLRDAGGTDSMWKGRAITLFSALLKVLVWKRDNDQDFTLSVSHIREHTSLGRIWALIQEANKELIPEDVVRDLAAFYKTIPGYNENAEGHFSEKMTEQHGYIIMQYAEAFDLLLNIYGHLFDVGTGDVNLHDVIQQGRILYVMLPMLEKSQDSAKLLGKMVLLNVKKSAAMSLGSQVQGEQSQIINDYKRPHLAPPLIILDEYQFYQIPGFSIVFAQIRSLGFSSIITAQSYAGLEGDNMEKEAASLVANTNIKIFGRIEPDDATRRLIKERGDQALTSKIRGYQEKQGLFSSLLPEKMVGIDLTDRISLRDLTNQKPGQVHLVYGDSIFRANMIYIQPRASQKDRTTHNSRRLNITLPVGLSRDRKRQLIFLNNPDIQRINQALRLEEQGLSYANLRNPHPPENRLSKMLLADIVCHQRFVKPGFSSGSSKNPYQLSRDYFVKKETTHDIID